MWSSLTASGSATIKKSYTFESRQVWYQPACQAEAHDVQGRPRGASQEGQHRHVHRDNFDRLPCSVAVKGPAILQRPKYCEVVLDLRALEVDDTSILKGI